MFLHAVLLLCSMLLQQAHGTVLPNCTSLGYTAPSVVNVGVLAGVSFPLYYADTTLGYTAQNLERGALAAAPLINANLPSGAPIIQPIIADIDVGSPEAVASAFIDLHGRPDPLALLLAPGLAASDTIAGSLASAHSIPVASYLWTGHWLSDKIGFPTFFRLVPGLTSAATSVRELLKVANVKTLTYVQERLSSTLDQAAAASLKEFELMVREPFLADDFDMSVIHVPFNASSDAIHAALKELEGYETRYVLIQASLNTFVRFIYYGHLAGLFAPRSDPYIITGGLYLAIQSIARWIATVPDPMVPGSASVWGLPADARAIEILQGLRTVFPGQAVASADPGYSEPLRASYVNLYTNSTSEMAHYNGYTIYAADSLYFLRSVLNAAQRDDKLCYVLGAPSDSIQRDVNVVSSYLRSIQTIGASGSIALTENLNVYGNMSFYSLNIKTDIPAAIETVPVIRSVTGESRFVLLTPNSSVRTDTAGIVAALKQVQWNSPYIGFIPAGHGRHNSGTFSTLQVALSIGLGAPVLLLLASFIVFRYAKLHTLKRAVELKPTELQESAVPGVPVPVRLGSLRSATFKGQAVSLQDIGQIKQPASRSCWPKRGTGPPATDKPKSGTNGDAVHVKIQRMASRSALAFAAKNTLLGQPPSWSLYTGSNTWPQMPWHYALVSKLQHLRHRNVVATLGLLSVPDQGLGPASSCLVHEALSCSLRKKLPALKAVKLKRKLILLHDVAQAIDFLKNMLPYGVKRAFLRRGIRLDHVWLDPYGTAKVAPCLEDCVPPADGADASGLMVAPELLELEAGATEASDVFALGALAYLLLYSLDESEMCEMCDKVGEGQYDSSMRLSTTFISVRDSRPAGGSALAGNGGNVGPLALGSVDRETPLASTADGKGVTPLTWASPQPAPGALLSSAGVRKGSVKQEGPPAPGSDARVAPAPADTVTGETIPDVTQGQEPVLAIRTAQPPSASRFTVVKNESIGSHGSPHPDMPIKGVSRFSWTTDRIPTGLPPGLVTALKRATALRPEERPSVNEIMALLQPKTRMHIITE